MARKQFITTGEASERLKVSALRVRQLVRAGRIRGEKFARDWLIDPASLAAVRVRKPGRPKSAKQKSSGSRRAGN